MTRKFPNLQRQTTRHVTLREGYKKLYEVRISLVNSRNEKVDEIAITPQPNETLILGRYDFPRESFFTVKSDIISYKEEPIYVFRLTVARYGCIEGIERECTSRKHLELKLKEGKLYIFDRSSIYTAIVDPNKFEIVEEMKKGVPYVLEPNQEIVLRPAGVFHRQTMEPLFVRITLKELQ